MIQTILERAVAAGRPAAERGAAASYIPELGKVDKRLLGACVFTRDGGRFSAGDTGARLAFAVCVICSPPFSLFSTV